MFLTDACLLALLGLLPTPTLGTNYDFLSRPDIQTPVLDVTYIDNSTVGDGYIFLTPSTQTPPATFTPGMRIYNNQGGLVWDGTNFDIPNHEVIDFQACVFKGQPHLCVTLYQGEIDGGVALNSFDLILDDTYSQALTAGPDYTYQGYPLTQDLHEFNVQGDGESALMSSYALTKVNVTFPHCPGSPSISWVKNGLFTETALDGTNRTIFAWSAIDHVPATDCYLCPCGGPKVGCGKSEADAFDYFHINAIDKDEYGDYLVSGRHVWTLFKIAGLNSPSKLAPGTIIWRLGGKQGSFDMKTVVPNSGTFNFSWQHHARFWEDGNVHFWDNANDAVLPPSALASSGMSVDIDEASMTATLVQQYISPGRLLDGSQGSHQILPNGNHFLGMGSIPVVFERTTAGDLTFSANFGVRPVFSYRSFRYTWTGHPAESQLALFAYAPTCGAKNAYHVSWNGATEVASYRFFAGNNTDGPFVQTGSTSKDWRFEVIGTGNHSASYSYAEAIDASGNVLGKTPTVKTFIPAPGQLAESCGPFQCGASTDYKTAPQAKCS